MCIVYCTIRYDDDIFIVRAKAETASLILPHCDITKKIMGETRDKKSFRSTRSSRKTMESALRKEKESMVGCTSNVCFCDNLCNL